MAETGHCPRAGYDLAWHVDGRSDGAPLLMLHSLGACGDMWEPQVAALADRRLLRLDWPGHGGSTVPPDDHPITIESLLADVLTVMDAVGWPQTDVLGLSLGGMVGLAFAARHPQRCRRLVVSNCGARIADTTILEQRLLRIPGVGLGAIADDVLAGWFSPSFRQERPEVVAQARGWLEACSADAYVRTARAVCVADLRSDLGRIDGPVTVISGNFDRPTPPAWQLEIVAAIPHAEHRAVSAAHLANVEAPEEYTAAAGGGLGFAEPAPLDGG